MAAWPIAAAFAGAEKSPNPTADSTSAQKPVPVRVAPAELLDAYQVRHAYTGTLVAARRSQLAFERTGKVIELVVDEGARVEHGQVLARLDRRRLAAQRRQAQADLAEARAVLAELESGARKETIAAAAAELRNLTAQRDLARLNLDRRRKLVETAAISREEYDQSFYTVKAAEARVDAAAKHLEELEAGERVERIEAQRGRVESLEAGLEDVERQLEDTQLSAPYAGSIVRRRVDEGAIVAAGEVVFDLIEDSRIEAWIGVPPETAANLRAGDEQQLELGADRLPARVKSIRVELDPATRTQNVVLEAECSPASSVVAGRIARIQLNVTVREQGFWVPADSLKAHHRGLWAVYVAEGDSQVRTVAARDVELLHTEGGRSFVRGALRPGDAVIVAGGHRVVEGQRVTVTAGASPE